jgi:hypothetical protein
MKRVIGSVVLGLSAWGIRSRSWLSALGRAGSGRGGVRVRPAGQPGGSSPGAGTSLVPQFTIIFEAVEINAVDIAYVEHFGS